MKDMALLARSGSSSSTVWIVRVSTVVIFTELLMMAYVWDLPRFFNTISMKPCIELPSPKTHGQAYANYPPKRVYKNNGYLLISCNGGLNQMRAAICDMVTIASFLNVTLIVPELDKTSFWADPSEFKDIFDVDHFILSLRNNVRVTRYLPKKLRVKLEQGTVYSMPPVSWSNLSYYHNQVLPLIKKHKVVRLNKTDTRLANNGIPFHLQKLRCHVNYGALKFTSRINELGEQVIKAMRRKGFFIALHLRYEMDMLAFSGCTLGCSSEEAELLTGLRYAYPWWREKDINAESKRKEGQCPLTPEETALVLKAFDFDSNVPIYIASGEIFGGDRRMATLYSTFPNIVRKEMILSPDDIRAFKNHSSQMAAIDYLVSLASDVFIPTYGGNMAKVVEGHRRYLGYRKTIVLDRVRLVYLIDQYSSGLLGWKEFSSAVKKAHVNHTGSPAPRLKIPDKPKEEEYFYANPNECLSENTRQT